MGASLIGGVWEMVMGFLIKPLRRFFPPVVTGVVVTAIGLSLISVGIGFFGGSDIVPRRSAGHSPEHCAAAG